jgi:toxin-antitoxin system, toxin component, GNAT family
VTDRKKVSLPVSWERLAQKYSKRKMKKVYEVKSLSLSDIDN